MLFCVISRAGDKDTMEIDADLDLDFLVATIGQRFNVSDLKLADERIHDWNITIVFCFDLEIIPSIEGEDFGERNLMKLGEYYHIACV